MPGFVCGSLSQKFILQADPKVTQTVLYICRLTVPLPFSSIICITYCLKNNDGHMSPSRHLVHMCCGHWLFLLTRWEVEHSAHQLQSFCYPQARLDKSAPYGDRGRRVLSGRNMNQIKALGFHFKRKMPLAAPFVFGCMGGQAFYSCPEQACMWSVNSTRRLQQYEIKGFRREKADFQES